MIGLVRSRHVLLAMLMGASGLALAFAPFFQDAPRDGDIQAAPATQPTATQPAGVLIALLGHNEYVVREDAMRQLIARGGAVADELRMAAEAAQDPEIRHRLRYTLEAILPPEQAVLVIRAAPNSDVKPGDLLTHVDFDRVRSRRDLERMRRKLRGPQTLRFITENGPRERSGFDPDWLLTTADYRAPMGEQVAQILRLYADGYAEKSYEKLREIREPIPENEMSVLLRAIIAYTAGDGTAALELLKDQGPAVRPEGRFAPWTEPSRLDMAGPLKAPFQIEAVLWQERSAGQGIDYVERDMAVQRVLVPANRYIDALTAAAAMWQHGLRDSLTAEEEGRQAGNMLAVSSWMLYNLDLQSECIRLIEPRSRILRHFTWMRVQVKGWLSFLAGREKLAIEEVFTDARDNLQRVDPTYALIRNPRVAARIAFFLYQVPDDPRIEEMLSIITSTDAASGTGELPAYITWLCYALNERNYSLIRKHVPLMFARMGDADAAEWVPRQLMLEYVADSPDAAAMREVRKRLQDGGASPDLGPRALNAAICDAIIDLAERNPEQAAERLQLFSSEPGARVLLHTARFMGLDHRAAELREPILAVPAGSDEKRWLVLRRDRRLAIWDWSSGEVAAVDPPTATWFPGPLNWPWIGMEPKSGRVWAYDRKRVIELAAESPFRVNIDPEEIPAFDRHVSACFSELAHVISRATEEKAENGEYLRADVKANADYVADPDLPEVGFIEAVRGDPRMVHVGVRGGTSLLIESSSGRTWTSERIGEGAGVESPVFQVEAAREQATPVLFLMSDNGLIRFEVAGERVERIAIPGEDPHPHLIPEWAPYERRDPRWVYFARLPKDGGQVFRIRVADNAIEKVDMTNFAFRESYYLLFTRGQLREAIDEAFAAVPSPVPPLHKFIDGARETVAAALKDQP